MGLFTSRFSLISTEQIIFIVGTIELDTQANVESDDYVLNIKDRLFEGFFRP